jgi:GH15 family glucan-1,4-alpha-glucosidase
VGERSAIGDYALIGDTRTAALVDPAGSVDWLCLPRFDGQPVFARLLAGDEGGRFAVSPHGAYQVTARSYRDGTTVVETTWQVGGTTVTLTEGMVADVEGTLLPTTCMVRRVDVRGGRVPLTVVFDPRFGDERRRPARWRAAGGGSSCSYGSTALWLGADRPLGDVERGPVEVVVDEARPLTLVLTAVDRGPLTYVPAAAAWRALADDAERWRRWGEGIDVGGMPNAALVRRSLITLRLLTYSPSGAPVAAPTTSLPEDLGGSRNWDYRYAWPRDASIGIGAFLGTGMVEHSRSFLYWLLHASRLDRPRLPALLTVHGRPAPAERDVEWPGFADSRPVRFGNGARPQHQLDNYGWVVDAMWLLVQAGEELFGETWRACAALADEVARRWRQPDSGIWEVRGEPAHWVHSKLMAWLALDRAARIASRLPTSARRVARWCSERDAVGRDVLANGFDHERNTFVRAYGRTDVDAALLVLPLVGLEPPGSARVRGTIAAIRSELAAGPGSLLFRYRRGDDGIEGSEGAFLPCSFWLAQALASTGDVDGAAEVFDELAALGGPLGLFSEEADPSTGALLGNHPQALTHAALVQAALAVRDAGATKGRAAGRAPRRTRRGRPS